MRNTRWMDLGCTSLCESFWETWKGYQKSWLLLGVIWEGQGLRQLGRNLRPCFFQTSPSLWVELSGNPTNVWLLPLCVFFQHLSLNYFYPSLAFLLAHTSWGFVCSSMVKESELTEEYKQTLVLLLRPCGHEMLS